MPHQEIPLATSWQPKPGQLRSIDTRDDRLELLTLLNHLAPLARVDFLEWACTQATLGRARKVRPQMDRGTYRLAEQARHSDAASERLNVSLLNDLVGLVLGYAIDLDACLVELVRRVRDQRAPTAR